MNSCILMAEVVQEPQLRYTNDQMAIAEMMVKFEGLRDDDPPSTLKVIGWGNLAQEIQSTYHEGDRIIIEGRLGMNTIDRPEGFREKRAELTAQRIHKLGMGEGVTSTADPSALSSTMGSASGSTSSPAPARSAPAAAKPKAAGKSSAKAGASEAAPSSYTPSPTESADYDDIPF
ncbi:MAG TPA: single-stranded DNA-binding protein [Chroococcidiopsis sp.]